MQPIWVTKIGTPGRDHTSYAMAQCEAGEQVTKRADHDRQRQARVLTRLLAASGRTQTQAAAGGTPRGPVATRYADDNCQYLRHSCAAPHEFPKLVRNCPSTLLTLHSR